MKNQFRLSIYCGRTSLILLFILFFGLLFSQQNKSDSLLKLLKKDKNDTNKIHHLNDLSWEFRNSKPDTSIILSKQALALGEKLKWKKGIAAAFGNLGVYGYLRSEFTEALAYHQKSLTIYRELNDKKGIANSLGNTGVVYQSQGEYPKALNCFLEALKIDQEFGNKAGTARHFGNIGSIHFFQGDYPKAISNYSKALLLGEELADKSRISIQLSNLGNVYYRMATSGKADDRPIENDSLYKRALEYYLRALKINEERGNKQGVASSLANMGAVYARQATLPGNTEQQTTEFQQNALKCFLSALKIREEQGAKQSMGGIIGNIGSLYFSMKKYKESSDYLFRSLAIFDSIGAKDYVKENYETLSQLYEKSTIPLRDTIDGKLLNMEEMRLRALYFYKRSISIRDTLFSEENKKQLVQKEMNFEFEKKEAITKAENLKHEEVLKAEAKRKNIIIWFTVLGLGITLLLSGFIFRALRITKKQKILIETQKHLVDEKQKEILDSIRYARRIQRALITNEKYILKNLKRLN
jgi:tetratricopeptide (TPR) repeat protein